MNGNGQLQEQERPRQATGPGLLVLTKDKPLAWAVMPEVLARIERFCRTYDTDSDPATLCQSVREHFVIDNPGMYLIVGISDGRVVGHVLAYLAAFDFNREKKFVNVIQYEIDEGSRASLDLLQLGLDLLEDWGRAHGATRIQAQAIDDSWERGLRTFYGMKKYRTLVRKAL